MIFSDAQQNPMLPRDTRRTFVAPSCRAHPNEPEIDTGIVLQERDATLFYYGRKCIKEVFIGVEAIGQCNDEQVESEPYRVDLPELPPVDRL
jgi:hypothetical protein